MKYIIDGYNLIGKLPHIQLSSKEKHNDLKDYLQNRLNSNDTALVVFDGKSVENTMGIHEGVGDIIFYFTEYGETADSYIINYCQMLTNKKSVVFVSSDKEVQTEIHRDRGVCISSTQFINTIIKTDVFDSKPNPSEDDTDYWLNVMSNK